MPPGGRHDRQRLHERALVLASHLVAPPRLRTSDQPPDSAVGVNRMRHERQLVGGMEPDEITDRPAPLEQAAHPLVCEHSLDEVLAQSRIRQPSFLLDRKRRQPPGQGGGEDASAGHHRHAVVPIDLDAFEAAARRLLFEDETGEILPFRFARQSLGRPPQRRRHVPSRFRDD